MFALCLIFEPGRRWHVTPSTEPGWQKRGSLISWSLRRADWWIYSLSYRGVTAGSNLRRRGTRRATNQDKDKDAGVLHRVYPAMTYLTTSRLSRIHPNKRPATSGFPSSRAVFS